MKTTMEEQGKEGDEPKIGSRRAEKCGESTVAVPGQGGHARCGVPQVTFIDGVDVDVIMQRQVVS